jgi:hypothetical protein
MFDRPHSPRLLFRAGLLALTAWAIGCATMQSGGFKVFKGETEDAFENVRNRASFELQCPKEKLELVVLNIMGGGDPNPSFGGRDPSQIGATGCGHRAVYLWTNEGWVMNTSDGAPK